MIRYAHSRGRGQNPNRLIVPDRTDENCGNSAARITEIGTRNKTNLTHFAMTSARYIDSYPRTANNETTRNPMSLQAIISAVLGCLLSWPFLSNGQTVPSAEGSAAGPSPAERHYPEQAYLSATRYTNEFFGFSFDLPVGAHLEPIPEPVATDGRIQLLELGGPPPADAAASIVALSPRGSEALDAKTMLRKALDQELFRGVEELCGLSKTMLAGHQFYFYETRRGIEQHMLAAANLDGYVVDR